MNNEIKHAQINWLVMNCGAGDDLRDIISYQNIAGNDHPMVIHCSISIDICMQFLNERYRIIHRNIK